MSVRAKRAVTSGRATRGVTFGTGMLIALERRHAGALALLRACRVSRASITIPVPVVAEWWRGTHRTLLETGTLEALTPELAPSGGSARPWPAHFVSGVSVERLR